MSEVLIRCEDVSKKFCRDFKRSLWYGVKDVADDFVRIRGKRKAANNGSPGGADFLSSRLRKEEFWAVNDVNFELRRGECLGLIGRNGAGKTTLLKMLNGLIKPDQGRIEINGRVGALIALGAGFSPILTGRENIYVNGSILRLSKSEIDAKFDEILDFAEISEFIDAPVQNYSSGMRVRLGFAVAAVLIQPDVLLLDEVLAVGDIGFTTRCLNRVRELVQTSAVVLVSHTMQHIGNFCTRAIVMQKGSVVANTPDVYSAIDTYTSIFQEMTETKTSGSGGATFQELSLTPDVLDLTGKALLASSGHVKLELEIDIQAGIGPCRLTVVVKTIADEPVMHMPCSDTNGCEATFHEGLNSAVIDIPAGDLNAGGYKIHLSVAEKDTNRVVLRVDNAASFRVVSNKIYWSKIARHATTLVSNAKSGAAK